MTNINMGVQEEEIFYSYESCIAGEEGREYIININKANIIKNSQSAKFRLNFSS